MAAPGDENMTPSGTPSLDAAFRLYDEDALDEFIAMAFDLLETNISRACSVKLLVLIANSVESPWDTEGYYYRALHEFDTMSVLEASLPASQAALTELRGDLERLASLVARGRGQTNDMPSPTLPSPPGFSVMMDGANDTGTAGREGRVDDGGEDPGEKRVEERVEEHAGGQSVAAGAEIIVPIMESDAREVTVEDEQQQSSENEPNDTNVGEERSTWLE